MSPMGAISNANSGQKFKNKHTDLFTTVTVDFQIDCLKIMDVGYVKHLEVFWGLRMQQKYI